MSDDSFDTLDPATQTQPEERPSLTDTKTNRLEPKLALEDKDRLRLRIEDTWYDLSGEAEFEMLQKLIEAKGAWVGGKSIGQRADKILKRMQKPVCSIIESDLHKGYRITRSFFP
jgi:hypothetical protein